VIANAYEDELIDRITIRELAATLNPRERRVLCRQYRYGETLRETGQAIGGIGPERVRQIGLRAERVMKGRYDRSMAHVTPVNKPEFVRHMKRLVDGQPPSPTSQPRGYERPIPIPPDPAWVLPLRPVPAVLPQYPQGIEPWFHPERVPTTSDMREIGQYALGYFSAARRRRDGTRQRCGRGVQIICERNADAIAGAMKRWADELPLSVPLSTVPDDVPEGMTGTVVASSAVAFRVLSVYDGKLVSIEATF